MTTVYFIRPYLFLNALPGMYMDLEDELANELFEHGFVFLDGRVDDVKEATNVNKISTSISASATTNRVGPGEDVSKSGRKRRRRINNKPNKRSNKKNRSRD